MHFVPLTIVNSFEPFQPLPFKLLIIHGNIVAKSKYELDWTNSIFLGENDGLYYYCYYPTDLRYDWSDTYQREEYQKLSESAESVMETFRLI